MLVFSAAWLSLIGTNLGGSCIQLQRTGFRSFLKDFCTLYWHALIYAVQFICLLMLFLLGFHNLYCLNGYRDCGVIQLGAGEANGVHLPDMALCHVTFSFCVQPMMFCGYFLGGVSSSIRSYTIYAAFWIQVATSIKVFFYYLHYLLHHSQRLQGQLVSRQMAFFWLFLRWFCLMEFFSFDDVGIASFLKMEPRIYQLLLLKFFYVWTWC